MIEIFIAVSLRVPLTAWDDLYPFGWTIKMEKRTVAILVVAIVVIGVLLWSLWPPPPPTPTPTGAQGGGKCPDSSKCVDNPSGGCGEGIWKGQCDCPGDSGSPNGCPCCSGAASPAATTIAPWVTGPPITLYKWDTEGIRRLFADHGLSDMDDVLATVSSDEHVPGISGSQFCECKQAFVECADCPKRPSSGITLDSLWQALGELNEAKLYSIADGKEKQAVYIIGLLAIQAHENACWITCDEVAGSNPATCKDADEQKCWSCGQGEQDYSKVWWAPTACNPMLTGQPIKAQPGISTDTYHKGMMECNTTPGNQGCCWWGRGAGQITYPNNYFAVNSLVQKVPSLKGLDVCQDPGLLCSEKYPNMYWLAGFAFFNEKIEYRDKGLPDMVLSLKNCWNALTTNMAQSLVRPDSDYWNGDSGGKIPFVYGLYGINSGGGWALPGKDFLSNACSRPVFVRLLRAIFPERFTPKDLKI